MLVSTNTTKLDEKSVQTPRTQPGYVGKFSVVVLWFQNVNKKIKTTRTTENLPRLPGCVLGIHTYILSKFVVFVETSTKLKLTMPNMTWLFSGHKMHFVWGLAVHIYYIMTTSSCRVRWYAILLSICIVTQTSYIALYIHHTGINSP